MFEQIKERQRFSRSKCVLTYPSLSDRRGRRSLQGWCDFLSLITEENQGVQPKIFGVRRKCSHKQQIVNGEADKPARASAQTLFIPLLTPQKTQAV